MKQILSLSGQTISDLAVQEYGNADLAFQILKDNPGLMGLNDFPEGHDTSGEGEFDVSYPIRPGVEINIDINADGANLVIANELTKIIS